MKKIILTLVSVLGLAATIPGAAAAGSGPLGIWQLDDGRLKVKVTNCFGNKICANVIWLPEPNNADGTPKLDLKNKNASLRSRKLIGMPVISGMTPAGNNYYKGSIYSSDDGANYRAYATLKGDRFYVKGCWLVICKDLNFIRSK